MNRQEAATLVQRYKDFPQTEIFSARPYNYPLFHLLECYSKGWRIDHVASHLGQWIIERLPRDNIQFERMGYEIRNGTENYVWRYVARNPNVQRSAIGFVQEDLYARYVGRCNPLKTSMTTWGFTPFEAITSSKRFWGTIGRNIPLYCLEIDMDTVDIIGKRNEKLPWHYLQQTINWKEYTDRIEWQRNQ